MPLVCKINDQNQAAVCGAKTIGGVRVTYAMDWNDVGTTTVASGILTAITMKAGATNAVAKFVFDDDNTASYNQEGSREGNTYRAAQAAFLKFTGITNAKVVASQDAKGVLKGLFFHVLNDGSIMLQGAEFAADGATLVPSYVGAKINPSVKSNTGEGESAVEYNIISTSADLVPTSMAVSALEALAIAA